MENIIYYQFIYLKKLLIGNSLIPDFYCKSTELMRRQDSRYHLEVDRFHRMKKAALISDLLAGWGNGIVTSSFFYIMTF